MRTDAVRSASPRATRRGESRDAPTGGPRPVHHHRPRALIPTLRGERGPMTDPTQPSAADPLRLVLDFGEVVEVDGSELLDPTAGRLAPAVVLRVPGHRAQWLGLVLSAYTRVCQLVGTEI